jgi:SAM-dependent methyltransferase
MRDVGSQASYWDEVAHKKRFSHPLRADWLSRYLPPQPLILDYGCGYGRTLEELAAEGYVRSVGVDFSEAMLTRCRLQLARQSLIRNDGRLLPFADGAFDMVLLFAVLTCVPEDDNQRALFSEIGRVLRAGGLLYVSDLLLNEDERNRARYESFHEAYGTYGVFQLPEGVVVRHHSREWIAELTSSFEQLEYEAFTVKTMNGNDSSAFQALVRKPL